MKIILLGTGTPNAEPCASGPAFAVICKGKTYLVDCGAGIVRACTSMFYKGVQELRPQNLTHVFITHLHSDHTAGFAELLLMPWVLERQEELHVFGPAGTGHMCSHIAEAYRADTDFRNDGPEPANHTGHKTDVHEITEGKVFEEDGLCVYAYRVSHGQLESYCYVFEADGKKAVFSGDTCALEKMKEIAKDADILIHEAQYTASLKERTPAWQAYHSSMHTMSAELADIIDAAKPSLTVTVHRILHLNWYGESPVPAEEIQRRENALLKEITDRTKSPCINGHDGDIFEI